MFFHLKDRHVCKLKQIYWLSYHENMIGCGKIHELLKYWDHVNVCTCLNEYPHTLVPTCLINNLYMWSIFLQHLFQHFVVFSCLVLDLYLIVTWYITYENKPDYPD